ncbi:hypothetical protein LEAN103870_10975 [Legionella anisa]|uniref:Uncharacterized protein n=1 Tax=Legionella anisa TaxID=28082 RepID=A0AAX0WVD6_9GAMM|nr:hypothetical protein [Legionella anisa]AWN74083.1 hypothetical protein DLD14_09640 [Legionella anisa]KTC69978.1 hypothetical protein Lani_2479 [Legionella anisa]MBN5936931.1 hypothetical protein [Legionella anisa]MCW8425895.1 hypothetical protein [Legionella anisa]MCW8448673.1 hypothetical protein [Legionella anisa]
MLEKRVLNITTEEIEQDFQKKIDGYLNSSDSMTSYYANMFFTDSMYTSRPKNKSICVMYRGTTQPPESVFKEGFIPKYDNQRDPSESVVLSASPYIGSLYADIQSTIQHKTAYVYATLIDPETAVNFEGQTLGFNSSRTVEGNNDLGFIDLMEYRSSAISPLHILAARTSDAQGKGPDDILYVNGSAEEKFKSCLMQLRLDDSKFREFMTKASHEVKNWHHQDRRTGTLEKAPFVPDYF